MAALGFFPTSYPTSYTSLLQSPKVIYTTPKAPPSQPISTSPPINRLPMAPPPPPKLIPPITISEPLLPAGPTVTNGGGGGTTAPPTTGGGGPATGAQTGGTGTTDTSRLFDLIASSFKPQDLQQSYGPQAVSSDATTGSGTNPMAVVILAILVIAGVAWYAHKKKAA